jgi:hypothetical protein
MKKSFIDKGNPALQFISQPTEEETEHISKGKRKAQGPAQPPKGYKVNPEFIEVKSRRLQLVIQPSLFDKVKAQAQAKNQSVNAYICDALTQALGK